MRRRNLSSQQPLISPSSTSNHMFKRLSSLDVINSKPHDDFAQPTHTGGIISILATTIITLLFFHQIYTFLFIPLTRHSITVDNSFSANQRLSIHYDITFTALSCDRVNIDLLDVTNEAPQHTLYENTFKQRLSIQTLQSLEAPYQDDDSNHNIVSVAEACRLYGELSVPRVAGNLHVALGSQSHSKDSHTSTASTQHLHQFRDTDLSSFNCSHVVNELRFGVELPTRDESTRQALNAMKGVEQLIEGNDSLMASVTSGVFNFPSNAHQSKNFQYFIRIIPTRWEDGSGEVIESAQYSFTQYVTTVTVMDLLMGGGQKIPGVFLQYDLAPYVISIRETNMTLHQFLTNLFAIVGGVSTLALIADSLAHQLTRHKVVSPNTTNSKT